MSDALTMVQFTCLNCGCQLELNAERCRCGNCGASWPCVGGIPRLFGAELHDRPMVSIRTLVERCLMKHSLLGAWDLEFLGTHGASSSEVLEYGHRNQPQARTLMIKHRRGVMSREESEQEVGHEFRVVEDLWARGAAFQGTIPRPVALLPETGAAIYERVPGSPMTAVLKRHANRLTGLLKRKQMCSIANASGKWLRSLHQLNAGPAIPHDSLTYLAKLAYWLGKGVSAGLRMKMASSVWDAACSSAERAKGQMIRLAGVHGDFIPQNIFVHGGSVAVIDFASFRNSDVVYEDLGFFVAACRLMASRSVYSRSVMTGMERAFLDGYGESLNEDLLDLYVLKATAMFFADQFTLAKPVVAEARKLNRITAQLEMATHHLLCS
jgi:aminoglycoside phosphotransferase (APT) family kinase protein